MLDGYTAVETSYCYTEQQGCKTSPKCWSRVRKIQNGWSRDEQSVSAAHGAAARAITWFINLLSLVA